MDGVDNLDYVKKKASERRIRLQKGVELIQVYGEMVYVGDAFDFYIVKDGVIKKFKAM